MITTRLRPSKRPRIQVDVSLVLQIIALAFNASNLEEIINGRHDSPPMGF